MTDVPSVPQAADWEGVLSFALGAIVVAFIVQVVSNGSLPFYLSAFSFSIGSIAPATLASATAQTASTTAAAGSVNTGGPSTTATTGATPTGLTS
jgi:hypothetical protein